MDKQVAVTGMACRVPGGSGLDEFYDTLASGTSAWSEAPETRFAAASFYHPEASKKNSINTTGGHYLEQDIHDFDGPFFNISAAEAQAMDPQQRLLMEVTYEALENAGLTTTSIESQHVAVFAACSDSEYAQMIAKDPVSAPAFAGTGNSQAVFANRISYFFDLRGPSCTVDTACSSGLTALHLAVQELRYGQSEIAVVAASHLITAPNMYVTLSNLGLLGDDGKCYAFDHRALGGYGRGEGVVVLVLKRLSAAVRDEDAIRAVIRESAIGQDGKSSGGLTSPSITAQEALIREAYRRAQVEIASTDYVEGHGTGTAVGDPVEIQALGRTFGAARAAQSPVLIGSLKSNMGHLEGASGLAATLKTILMVEKGYFLPNADHLEENEASPPSEYNLQVCKTLKPWRSAGPRTASVNNFGFGGSNAHIIVQQYDASQLHSSMHRISVNGHGTEVQTNGHHSPSPQTLSNGTSTAISPMKRSTKDYETESVKDRLFVLSAQSAHSLEIMVTKMTQFLTAPAYNPHYMAELAYTLCQRRTHWHHRIALSASRQKQLLEKLMSKAYLTDRASNSPRIGFVFTGQGAAWPQMGFDLVAWSPQFRTSLESADQDLRDLGCPWSLLEELQKPEKSSRMVTAEVSQPATTAIQIALVDTLRSWGVVPHSVTGHSSGEIAAAYAAGILSSTTCLKIAYHRGCMSKLLQEQHPKLVGSMLALGCGVDEARSLLEAGGHQSEPLVIACENSPESVTISGDKLSIEALEELAKSRGLFARILKVDVAYHSFHMEAVAEDYRRSLGTVEPIKSVQQPEVLVFSSLRARQLGREEMGTQYWVDNLISPVLFSTSLGLMCHRSEDTSTYEPVEALIELGPHGALKQPIIQILKSLQLQSKIGYQDTIVRNEPGPEALLRTAAALFTRGTHLDFQAINQTKQQGLSPRLRTDLPSYCWNRKYRYWLDSRVIENTVFPRRPAHDLLGQLTEESTPLQLVWRNLLNVSKFVPWIKDHTLQGDVLFPGAGYMVMAIEAKRYSRSDEEKYSTISLREVSFSAALVLSEGQDTELLTYLSPSDEEARGSGVWDQFRIVSYSRDGGAVEHCRGYVTGSGDGQQTGDVLHALQNPLLPDSKAYATLCPSPLPNSRLYGTQSKMAFEFGPLFRPLDDLHSDPPYSRGSIKLLDTASTLPHAYESPYVIHPTTLDACLQFSVVCLHSQLDRDAQLIPSSVARVTVNLGAGLPDAASLRAESRAHFGANKDREVKLHMRAFRTHGEESAPFVSIEDASFALFRPEDTANSSASQLVQVAGSKVDWRPLNSMLQPQSAHNLFAVKDRPQEEELEKIRTQELISYYSIKDALDQISIDMIPLESFHLRSFYEWAIDLCEKAEHGNHDFIKQSDTLLPAADRASYLEQMRSRGHGCEFLYHVGRNLPVLLRGEVDAIEIMMQENRLTKQYEDRNSLNRLSKSIANLCENYCHQNPDARIIEIGGGTGIATLPVLEQLQVHSSPTYSRFEEYMFTDISSGFFTAAQEKFGDNGHNVIYKPLDISKAPEEQDFRAGRYDIVIAICVLHATPDIRQTLRNTQKLLKPGGRLILVETTRSGFGAFPFVLTPGWWLSADSKPEGLEGDPLRCGGPLMTQAQWQHILKESGFPGGVSMLVEDFPGCGERHNTLMVCESSETEPKFTDRPLVVAVHDLGSDGQRQRAERLREKISQVSGSSPDVLPFMDLTEEHLHSNTCVVLDSAHSSLLLDPTEKEFAALQVLPASNAVLWITQRAWQDNYAAQLVAGFANSLRNELTGLKFVTLDLESDLASSTQDIGLSAVTNVLQSVIRDEQSEVAQEVELREWVGLVEVPRVIQDETLSKLMAAEEFELITGDLIQPDRPLRLVQRTVGDLESMYFTDDLDAQGDLPSDMVEVEPKAYGLNFREVLVALGQVPGTLGIECSAVVRSVGSDVATLQPGDRVVVEGAGYATRPRCQSKHVFKIPDNVSFTDAVAVLISFKTAWYALMEQARITADDTILVHAGAGGLGQAMIQVANMAGATVFATCSSEEKKSLLVNELGVASERIFSSRTTSFRDHILQATNGRGVDIIANSLAGEFLRLSWECIAPHGRFLELGKKDVLLNSRLAMSKFNQNVMFIGVDLGLLNVDKPQKAMEIAGQVYQRLSDGTFKCPQPITKFPISELSKAFRLLGSGKTMGKVVIEVDPHDQVKIQKPSRPKAQLRKDASYLITGGTGGIGLSVCKHLARRGAGSVILVSRSGGKPEDIDRLHKDVTPYGCKVTVLRCDVGDVKDLRSMLDHCQKTLPPVRGIIHGAMYLKDLLFEGMSHEHFMLHIRPKVQCAIELVKYYTGSEVLQATKSRPTDCPLDFLMFWSSASGLNGNKGQTPYAATSTFLDGFASFCQEALHIPTSVVDLGVVAEIGYVAKNEKVLKLVDQFHNGFKLSEENVLNLVEAAIQGHFGQAGKQQVQCIAGAIPQDNDEAGRSIGQMTTVKFSMLKRMYQDVFGGSGAADPSAAGATAGADALLRQKLSTIDKTDKAALEEVIYDGLAAKLSGMLLVPREEIVPEKKLQDFGLDSLVSVELRNWLTRDLEVNISMPKLLSLPSIASLVERIIEVSALLATKE